MSAHRAPLHGHDDGRKISVDMPVYTDSEVRYTPATVIINWNDAGARDKRHVVSKLRAAAKHLRGQ